MSCTLEGVVGSDVRRDCIEAPVAALMSLMGSMTVEALCSYMAALGFVAC